MSDAIVHRYQGAVSKDIVDPDPVTTQILRNSLISAGSHMRKTVVRTAVSPSIYDMQDFSAALYDTDYRLLGQAETMPLFMSTLNYCVKAAVAAVGGTEQLEEGDVLLYNLPYETGTHANDVAVVAPVFMQGQGLIGYTAVRAHWVDIGGVGGYSTNTLDIFMEGVIYPGVKVYQAGNKNEEIFRMITANSRVPTRVAGDLHAQVNGCQAGAKALVRAVERLGYERFREHIEHMYNAGEVEMRRYLQSIPDGRYVGTEMMDSNGINDEPVHIEVAVEVEGSTVRVDYSNCPAAQQGPINSPLPGTISVSRIAIYSLVGAGGTPNEGSFRPVEVVTRPGTMFHPLPPAPCFLYAWPELVATEAIYKSLAQALPDAIPASSAGDFCIVAWWGMRELGYPWGDGIVTGIGIGASSKGDGCTGQSIVVSGTRKPPVEVWEAKNPWLFDWIEIAQDSCGPGKHQGGSGVNTRVHILEDSVMTNTTEHTKTRPAGLFGGESARSNSAALQPPGGEMTEIPKLSAHPVAKGSVFELRSGGGGGYGPAAEREPEKVLQDIRDGYITEAFARKHYPQAFAAG